MIAWRALDPRARALAALIWSLALVSMPRDQILVAAPIAFLLMFTCGADRASMIRAVRAMVVLWLLSAVANAWLVPGERLGPEALRWLRPTREGLIAGLTQGARLAALTSISVWIFATTGLLELASGIEWGVRNRPRLRQRVHRAVFPLVLGCRMVPAMREEAQRLLDVQALRGEPTGRLRSLRRMAGLAPLWVTLVVGRADSLSEALVLRGYDPARTRGFLRSFRWAWRDSAFVAVSLGAVFLLGWR